MQLGLMIIYILGWFWVSLTSMIDYFIIDFAVLLKQNYLVKIYLFINLVIGWVNTTILSTLITVTQNLILESQYCVKSVRIWSYSDPYLASFGRKYLHSVSLRIQSECGKITDQNNSEYSNKSISVNQFSPVEAPNFTRAVFIFP